MQQAVKTDFKEWVSFTELRLSKMQDLVKFNEKVLADLNKPLTGDKQKRPVQTINKVPR